MSKHLYFLGIGGTLMGSLAHLRQWDSGEWQRHRHLSTYAISGKPITAFEGFDPSQLAPPDEIIMATPACHAAMSCRIHLRAQPKLHLGGRVVRPRST